MRFFRNFFLLAMLLCSFLTAGARTIRVLFIGNSYTYTNDLPIILREMALADSITLQFAISAPGGFTLREHTTYYPTQVQLAQPDWDYVVLQEQSQLPSFPQSQVDTGVYPYARKLDSMAHAGSPCAKVVFYMTWGRKNGDAANCPFWPPVCTYTGMDSLLQLRYSQMAADNGSWIAPVAKVWRRLRARQPGIELYQPDESHPSAAGSFAAACTFYALMAPDKARGNTYPYILSAAEADSIRRTAGIVVSDSLAYWQRHHPLPLAAWTPAVNGQTLTTTNLSTHATGYRWDFGDNSTSTQAGPVHTYAQPGFYDVTLRAFDSCDTAQKTVRIQVFPMGIAPAGKSALRVYPNPAGEVLHLEGLQREAHYAICHLTGVLVRQGRVAPGPSNISLRQLPAGVYLLTLDDGSGVLLRQQVTVVR